MSDNPFHRPHVRLAMACNWLLNPLGWGFVLQRDPSNRRWFCKLMLVRLDPA